MRIAVLSDVHSHSDRLAQVLERIEQAGLSERFLLGDIIGLGPDPVGAVRMARGLELVLAGNHEAWLLSGRGSELDRRLLSGRDMVWLASLSPQAEKHGIRCCHGTPSDPVLGFFDDRAAATELASLGPGALLLVGHTHVPLVYVRERGRVFKKWETA